MLSQKGPHVKARLFCDIAAVAPDGASMASEAAGAHALGLRRARKLPRAGTDIVAGSAERACRTRRKAGPFGATRARAGAAIGRGEFQLLGEEQRTAIAVP